MATTYLDLTNEVKERFQQIPKTKNPKPKTAYSEKFYSKEELKKLEI